MLSPHQVVQVLQSKYIREILNKAVQVLENNCITEFSGGIFRRNVSDLRHVLIAVLSISNLKMLKEFVNWRLEDWEDSEFRDGMWFVRFNSDLLYMTDVEHKALQSYIKIYRPCFATEDCTSKCPVFVSYSTMRALNGQCCVPISVKNVVRYMNLIGQLAGFKSKVASEKLHWTILCMVKSQETQTANTSYNLWPKSVDGVIDRDEIVMVNDKKIANAALKHQERRPLPQDLTEEIYDGFSPLRKLCKQSDAAELITTTQIEEMGSSSKKEKKKQKKKRHIEEEASSSKKEKKKKKKKRHLEEEAPSIVIKENIMEEPVEAAVEERKLCKQSDAAELITTTQIEEMGSSSKKEKKKKKKRHLEEEAPSIVIMEEIKEEPVKAAVKEHQLCKQSDIAKSITTTQIEEMGSSSKKEKKKKKKKRHLEEEVPSIVLKEEIVEAAVGEGGEKKRKKKKKKHQKELQDRNSVLRLGGGTK